MSFLGDLKVKLGVDTSAFTSGFKVASSTVQAFNKEINSNFKSINNGVQEASKSFHNLGNTSGTSLKSISRVVQGILISQGFYKLASDIKSAAHEMVVFSQSAEQARASFGILLKDLPKAARFTTMVEDFAAETPYTFQQAADNARKLLAYGFQAESLKPVMNTLADAAAAAGDPEAFNRVGKAIGQIRTKGKLASQELLQLTEAGIPAFEILREKLNLTADQLGNIGRQGISADTAIQAILQGMQERYGGAAKVMAETTKGLLSTIKDNALIIGNTAFEPIFMGFKNILRKMRDATDRWRESIRSGGFGQLMHDIFPPEVLLPIQRLVANFQSLLGALRQLASAWGPLWSAIGQVVINVLNLILPLLTMLTQALAWVAQMLMSSTPAVRAFVATLAGLFITNVVIKLLVSFGAVLRSLFIVKALSALIVGLGKAIQFLAISIMTHPWIALLGVAAGSLVYFGMTSKKVSGWIGGLGDKISTAFGNDPSKVFAPKMKENTKQTGEFSKKLDVTTDNLDKMGDAAKKAGKKAKEGLQAFDEVFLLRDEMADETGADGGLDMGELGDLGDIGAPEIPPIEIPEPEFPEVDMPIQSWVDKFKNTLLDKLRNALVGAGIGAVIGGVLGGIIGGPGGAVLGAKIGALAGSIGGLFWDSLTDQMKNTVKGAGIGGAIGGVIGAIIGGPGGALIGAGVGALVGGIAGYFWENLKAWWKDVTDGFKAWWDSIKEGFTSWWADTKSGWSEWWKDTADGFSGWWTDTKTGWSTWWSDTKTGFSTWWNDTKTGWSTWWSDTKRGISTWASDTFGDLVLWWGDTKRGFSTWVSDTYKSFLGWKADTHKRLQEWGSDTFSGLSTWWSDTKTGFGTWWSDTKIGFSDWWSRTKETFSNWRSGTGGDISSWVSDTYGSFVTWKGKTIGNIKDWARDTGSRITTWYDQTKGKFSDWWGEVGGGFGSWWRESSRGFNDWAKGVFQNVVGWFGNLRDKLHNFFEDLKFWKDDAEKEYRNTSNYDAGSGRGGASPQTFSFRGADLPGHARGGVFNREHVARFAEGNRAEAIIPLENAQAMQPFVDAVTSGLSNSLVSVLGNNQQEVIGGSDFGSGNRQILYVGNLIADEPGLRELNRRMEIIRLNEAERRGIR